MVNKKKEEKAPANLEKEQEKTGKVGQEREDLIKKSLETDVERRRLEGSRFDKPIQVTPFEGFNHITPSDKKTDVGISLPTSWPDRIHDLDKYFTDNTWHGTLGTIVL